LKPDFKNFINQNKFFTITNAVNGNYGKVKTNQGNSSVHYGGKKINHGNCNKYASNNGYTVNPMSLTLVLLFFVETWC